MNSQTVSFYTVSAAVYKAQEVVRGLTKPVNDYQIRFITDFYHPLDIDKIPEISSYASTSASELNKILADAGFDIRLDEFSGHAFGVVSILDLLLQWQKIGEKGKIDYKYAGVRLDNAVTFRKSHLSYYPIACIETKNGDLLYMVIADKPLIRFSLMKTVSDIIEESVLLENVYRAVRFPTVTYNQQIDLSWLLGLQFVTKDDLWYIGQALQQTKFELDEKGAYIKDAVAIEMVYAGCALAVIEPVDMIIDKPFYLLVQRKGLRMPLFVGYFSYDTWKLEV